MTVGTVRYPNLQALLGSEHLRGVFAVEAQPRTGLDEIRDFTSAREEVLVNAFHHSTVFL